MKLRLLGALTALLLNSSFAQAAIDVAAIAQSYIDQGYTRVEVKVFTTEVKIEAIQGTTKLEVTYDAVTGAIIKSETDNVDPGENTTPGVFIRNEDESGGSGGSGGDDDFDDSDGDSSDDHHSGSHDSDDDSDDDHGSDHDDEDDDHGGDRSGSSSGHG